MVSNSKRTSLIILGVTAVVISRSVFFFIDDPEGPNLLIVGVFAAIVYGLSLPVYLKSSIPSSYKLGLTVLAQVVIVTAFYIFLG